MQGGQSGDTLVRLMWSLSVSPVLLYWADCGAAMKWKAMCVRLRWTCYDEYMDLEERIKSEFTLDKKMSRNVVWNGLECVACAEPLKGYEFKKLGELQRPKNEVIMGNELLDFGSMKNMVLNWAEWRGGTHRGDS